MQDAGELWVTLRKDETGASGMTEKARIRIDCITLLMRSPCKCVCLPPPLQLLALTALSHPTCARVYAGYLS